MNFFTKVDLPVTDFKIDYNSRLAFFGSCFADNIASRLAAAKFRVTASPSGVLFNPESIASAIERYSKAIAPIAEELHEGDEGWYSFDFH
uniref:GSCFA domain-containing protein n=1 Tax=uncultured Fibrobacter sp. TaxID=261512 RepID=UPI002621927B